MLSITSASGNIPLPVPQPGPMLTVTLQVTNITNTGTVNVVMQIEDLNGSTRDHAAPTASVRLFHMMCGGASSDEEKAVFNAIAAGPQGFYAKLYAYNNMQQPPPLILFQDTGDAADSWEDIETNLANTLSVLNAAEAAAPTATPCYVMIISSDPLGNLLDVDIAVVAHP